MPSGFSCERSVAERNHKSKHTAGSVKRLLAKGLLTGLSICVLGGCSTHEPRPANDTPDQAFIYYQSPPEKSKGLRLAVIDLIDMQGLVTSAGSEFLAKYSPPAKRDAECLMIARQRNVHFVGKTNTTELAVAVSGINK